MHAFSKNMPSLSPWSAIGEFINAMRFDTEPAAPILDDIGGKNAAVAPDAMPPLFECREKIIGKPTALFPHAAQIDTSVAAANPTVAKWLDMLTRLQPFNVKGQIAGIHRYLSSLEDMSPLATVARALPWTGPILRAGEDDFGNAALVRYVSLRHLGVHTERLRLAWVSSRDGAADWVVLAVALGGQWVILDHYRGDIVGEDVFLDAAPYFSLNAEHCRLHWQEGAPGGAETSLARLAARLKFSRA